MKTPKSLITITLVAIFAALTPVAASVPEDGLIFRFDASDLTYGEGEAVTAWVNSGSIPGFLSVFESQDYTAPLMRHGYERMNGQPVVEFIKDTTQSSTLAFGSFLFDDADAGLTIFAAATAGDTRVHALAYIGKSEQTGGRGVAIEAGVNPGLRFGAGYGSALWETERPFRGGEPVILTTVFTQGQRGMDSHFRINGEEVEEFEPHDDSGNEIFLQNLEDNQLILGGRLNQGGGRTVGNQEYSGFLGEILIYNRQLSVEEIEAVEAYLAATYGFENPYVPSGYLDMRVGADSGEPVNWGSDLPAEGSGGWGVTTSTYAGFTMTSMVNGVEDGELSWGGNDVAVGVNSDIPVFGNDYDQTSFLASINRSEDSSVIEAIQLDLPAANAVIGPDGNQAFQGLTRMGFTRLNQHMGSHVSIVGFVEDPQASWFVDPVIGDVIGSGDISYDPVLGKLLIVTDSSSDDFGIVVFDNPNATLSDEPVSLILSNDFARHQRGGYGIVGWSYDYAIAGPFQQALEFAGADVSDANGMWIPLGSIGSGYGAHYPWIYVPAHGWLYSAMNTWSEGGWFYDPSMEGWWASTAAAYPWVVVDGEGWINLDAAE